MSKDFNTEYTDYNYSDAKVKREKKKAHNKILQMVIAWAIFIAIIAVIAFTGFKAIQFIAGLFSRDYKFEYTPCENWSECETIEITKSDYAVGIQFPLIDKSINKAIKNNAKKLFEDSIDEIQNFEKGKDKNRVIYTISYSVTKNSDNYFSVLYSVHKVNPLREINDTYYISKIYDVSTGKEISAVDIFDGEYPYIASEYAITIFENDNKYAGETLTRLFVENTKPTFDNYDNISFVNNMVRIYFNPGEIFTSNLGAAFVDIPLSKLYKNAVVNVTDYSPPAYDPEKPMIALTFDDGPYSPVTSRILDVLEKYDSRATFFILGSRVEKEKDMVIRGNSIGCEYGNHTWSHMNLSTSSPEEMAEQINKTDDALYSVIGKKIVLSRAPYAAVNETVSANATKPFIGWTIDTMDWETLDTEYIKGEILRKVKDGDIILMHDLYSNTAAAIEQVVPILIENGYQLVTVSELMEARNIIPVNGQVYYSFRK